MAFQLHQHVQPSIINQLNQRRYNNFCVGMQTPSSPIALFQTNGNDNSNNDSSEGVSSSSSEISSSTTDLSSDSNSNDNQKKKKKKYSFSRAGGRSRKIQPSPPQPKDDNNKGGIIPFWLYPIVAFALASLWTFVGNDNDFYYYSYESSVYETRTYGEGMVETTTRRESRNAKSNIPGFNTGGNDIYIQLPQQPPPNEDMRIFMIEEDTIPTDPRLDMFLEEFFE